MYTGLLHSHRTVVIAFLFIYLIKLTLLLLGRKEALARFGKWIRIPEMIISTLFLVTGIAMMTMMGKGQVDVLLIVKIALVFASIPLAVIGFRRSNLPLAILSVFLIVVVYGLAEMRKSRVVLQPLAQGVISNPEAQGYELALHGKALFEANCTGCHGADGKLNGSGAKDLTLSKLTEESVRSIIYLGKNAMPAYGKYLSEQEVNALTVYVQTFRN